jgi:hypothetical protein
VAVDARALPRLVREHGDACVEAFSLAARVAVMEVRASTLTDAHDALSVLPGQRAASWADLVRGYRTYVPRRVRVGAVVRGSANRSRAP